MPERKVICNTSPLLYLHQVNQLDLLPRLYGEVLVPPAVHKELLIGAQKGVNVPDISQKSWIRVQPVADSTRLPALIDLGSGETEVIALGLTFRNSLLLLDDQLGRHVARSNGLTYTGTFGVLIKAKKQGYLPSVVPVIDKLRKTSMRMGDELVRLVLAEAGETESP